MFMVKRLTETNSNQLIEFVSLRLKNKELYPDYLAFSMLKAYEYFDTSQDEKILLGAFDDDNLIATMGMAFSKVSPTWLLFFMITSRSSFDYNLKENGLANLMETALDIAENKQVYRYYTFIKKRILPFTYDKWFKYVPRLNNYTFAIEGIIPANTKSSYPLFSELGFNKVYSEDYIVRSATAHDSIRVYKNAYNRH